MLQQPKRSEINPWFLYIMALAIIALFGALLGQDQIHRQRVDALLSEIQKCQENRIAAEKAYREENAALYKAVQDFREEIYRQSMAQQRELKKLRKK